MSVEKIKDLKESPEIKLNEGVDELSAVTDIAFTRLVQMNNWRVSEDGERCEKRDGVAEIAGPSTFGAKDVFGYHTYYDATPAFCQLVITEDKVWRSVDTSVSPCDATTDWVGQSLSIDTDDKKEGTGSLKDTIAAPVIDTWYNTIYNPTGSWDWSAKKHILFWLKCDRANTAFTYASLTIYDTLGNWRTWDLTFSVGEWTAVKKLLSTGDRESGTPPNLALINNIIIQFKTADTTPFYKKIDHVRVAGWTSIHTWASTLAHPVKVHEVQNKQIIITEIENIMILPDGTKVQVGISAPTTLPTLAVEYLDLDLDEDCASFNSQWTDADAGNGVSSQVTFDSKSCFKFLTAAGSGDIAMRRASLAQIGPDYTFEASLYFDEMGIADDNDHFEINIYNGRIKVSVRIDAQGMNVYDGTNRKVVRKKRTRVRRERRQRGDRFGRRWEGTWEEEELEEREDRACPIATKDIWKTLKLVVKSSDPDNEVVEVFVDGKSMGEHSCADKDTSNPGRIELAAYGDSTATIVYTDWIKLKSADIKSGNLKGTYRYAVTYARSGNYPNESNPIKAIVGAATYTKSNGTELDDLTPGGTYTGDEDITIRVQIDGTGTPDTIKWSEDGGQTWNSETMPITSTMYLPFGIELAWGALTGHTTGDYWEFTCDALTVNPTNQKVDLTSIPTSSDTDQVDQRKIYRTQPGGAAYYLVAIINDNTTTTFTDNIPDAMLGAAMSEDNDIAPLGKYSLWWDGRLWIGDDDENLLYYSKTWVPDAFDTNNRYVSVRRGKSNDEMTGMIDYIGFLWVFKREAISYVRKRLSGSYGVYDGPSDFGNIAPWSLLVVYGLLMFLSHRGWEVFNGEGSFNIRFSKSVMNTIKSIDKTKLEYIQAAHLKSMDEILLSLPDRTGGASAVTIVCNYLKAAFYTFSYSKVPSCLIEARDSSKEMQLIMGTRDGYVGTCESGTQDFSTNITATIRTGWWKFPIYQNFPMTEVEYEAPTGNTLTFNQYVNFDKDVQRTEALAGATPTSTDRSIRLPIKNIIKKAIRGKYLATEFTNAENVGSDIKLNWFKEFYAPLPRKGEIRGD